MQPMLMATATPPAAPCPTQQEPQLDPLCPTHLGHALNLLLAAHHRVQLALLSLWGGRHTGSMGGGIQPTGRCWVAYAHTRRQLRHALAAAPAAQRRPGYPPLPHWLHLRTCMVRLVPYSSSVGILLEPLEPPPTVEPTGSWDSPTMRMTWRRGGEQVNEVVGVA